MSDGALMGFEPRRLRDVTLGQFATRFAFGALTSAAAALVAMRYGPLAGGLFLAFPAILPAALTLIEQKHNRRDARADDRGAIAGAPGLTAFAIVLVLTADRWPLALSLAAASVAWLVLALGCYLLWAMVVRGRHRRDARDRGEVALATMEDARVSPAPEPAARPGARAGFDPRQSWT